jgi:hypothetical protein
MYRALVMLGISGLGVAAGVFSLRVAREAPAYSFAGASVLGATALVGVGCALIACGLGFWARRPGSRFALLLGAAGFAWFLLEWINPGIGSPIAFSIGLVLYAICAPLVAHAVLAYPGGRLSSRVDRGVLVVAYAGSLIVLCLACARVRPGGSGVFAVPSQPAAGLRAGLGFDDLNRVGVWLGVVWAFALAVLVALKLATAVRG